MFQFEKFSIDSDYAAVHAQQMLESAKRRLRELYEKLAAPVVAGIDTPHLVIVPHGSLHFLPFHALYDGMEYLIDRFEISYAPSATVFNYCLNKQAIPDGAPLLVGIADESAPLVAREIAGLSGMFPEARILLNGDATRAAFRETAVRSSFLHIATHAMFRRDNPMFSGFRLADGWLTALDLFSMTCATNLVTLSACQSGMNAVVGADDLVGLMRGFLYSGARSLLLSLWHVNDAATTALMTRFYREWRQGVSRSAALRRAMLATRAGHPHPFYWAPFVLVGNP
jgi:CHAT domain-containing protein